MVESIFMGFGDGFGVTENKLQQYIFDNSSKFGLFELKYLCGKGGGGGDFSALYNGERIKVEVEWIYSDYGNHIGVPKFLDVKMLICVDGIYPNERWKKVLPPIIKYYNQEDFNNWLMKNCGRIVNIYKFRYNEKKKHPKYIVPLERLNGYLYYKWLPFLKLNESE